MRKRINSQLFEWDDEKAKVNEIKHGISFHTAARVFSDENRIERPDMNHSDDEERWQVIGEVGSVLFVVYTDRGEATRLISARKATARERSIYYASQEMD